MGCGVSGAVCKVGRATVRIHGEVNKEAVKAATERYVKRMSEELKKNERLEHSRTGS